MAYALTYSYANQAYTVTGYTGTPVDVIIPETYNDGTHGEYPVTSIRREAFEDCRSLMSITISNSVTSIGLSAFFGCSSLTSIVIPDSVTSIGHSALRKCSSLTSVIISNSVTSIEESTFWGCSSLTSITIPDSITSIEGYAFYDCSNLTSIIIPDSVESIGNYAFRNCSSLTSINIGDSVTSIGEGVFLDCSNLTSINVSENNANYKSIDGNLYSKDGETLIQYAIGKTATTFIILDYVTSIGKWAFSGCTSLTSITIGNGVTSIGVEVFTYCSNLTSVIIPDGVTNIGSGAFGICNSLVSITIPYSITSMGDYAFYSCSSLQNVILLPDTPPTLGANAFTNISANAKFYCRKSFENAYKTATNWNTYASKIIGDDIALYFAMNANSTKEYISKNYLMKTGIVLSINDTIDNIQAILTSNDSTIIKGNLSAIISSDACDIGDENTDKNGRQTIISSKSSTTNGNDTAIIAARKSKIISDDNSHSTESAIIGGYFNIIEKVQRAVIAGGSENTIVPELGSDALYGFIGGGQNNQVKHRNSATIGGQHLITTRTEQTNVGRYNDITLADVLFAVGNGTAENSRSNAMTVYNDGKVDVKQLSIHKSLVIFGGDGANDAKIALDQSRSGQITDSGTKTLFGFTSNGATDLKVGSSSYQLVLRGSGTNFTYNGNEIPNKTYVDTGLSARVPITRTIAGLALSANISADDLTSALFTITEVTV